MGKLLHSAVELFAAKVEKGNYNWFTLTDEDREQLSAECVSEVITDYRNTLLFDSSRNEYMIERMKRLVKRAVWALIEQIRQGVFIPEKLETPFFIKEGTISCRDVLTVSIPARRKIRSMSGCWITRVAPPLLI